MAQLLEALKAHNLWHNSSVQEVSGNVAADHLEITDLFYRAQEVIPGGLFVAVKGFAADGHDYIHQAVARKATAVVCERAVPATGQVVTIPVSDSRKALAVLAAEFYGHPSRQMTVVGLTGTNGKTTTSYLIERVMQEAGLSAGVIGTVNYRYAGNCFDNPVTTPESLDLQRILADMHTAGVTHVVMEISSHALDLSRVYACDVDVAVFTNLSQDHLDFHHTMEKYWASKRKLFDQYLTPRPEESAVRAVINADDMKGRQLAEQLNVPLLTTGQSSDCAVRAHEQCFDLNGITARVSTSHGDLSIRSPLAGRHNLENILNAVGVGIALGIAPSVIEKGILAVDNVPGRLERVVDPAGQRFVYVDYAHTPDALENALQALRPLTRNRIICIFGCGGDRDRNKRPLMGAIAARLSDLAVVTSDNPRTERPEQIIGQIVAGIHRQGHRRYDPITLVDDFEEPGYIVEEDRRKAIRLGIRAALSGDTVLIAGKGHEPYQILGRQKYPFDDRLEAKAALEAVSR